MILGPVGIPSWFRCLVVALVTLGTGLDVVPIPLLSASDPSAVEAGDPLAPSQDDERDETPDDVSDLSWPQVRMVVRAGASHPRSGWPDFPRADRLGRARALDR